LDTIYESALKLGRAGKPFVIVTITASDGSTPRKIGAKMIVLENGDIIGTIGGGPLEHKCAAIAVETLGDQKCRKVGFELSELALTCGGSVEVFFEPHPSRDRAVIFGGGHIAYQLVPLLNSIGFRTAIVEDRSEYLQRDRYADCEKILTPGYGIEELEKSCSEIDLKDSDYVVIITRGHELSDGKVLDYLIGLPFNFKYAGMIGSKNKVFECMKGLVDKGCPKDKLARVFAPVGLDIGGETPAEIAVSIAAQMLAVKYSKDGKHVKDKKGYFNN